MPQDAANKRRLEDNLSRFQNPRVDKPNKSLA